MAKSRRRARAFGGAGARARARGRARPVTTALRKINIINNEKVRALNKVFTEVQKEVKHLSKDMEAEPQKEHQDRKKQWASRK
ncbi:ribosomal biogenesis factor isoform X2 [Rhea pennata]|uniref:ribosomal biogenesis factor isoform X2 n=1 Tax=Rhea pennata TaxID=8795 RepID=UPI002E262304